MCLTAAGDVMMVAGPMCHVRPKPYSRDFSSTHSLMRSLLSRSSMGVSGPGSCCWSSFAACPPMRRRPNQNGEKHPSAAIAAAWSALRAKLCLAPPAAKLRPASSKTPYGKTRPSSTLRNSLSARSKPSSFASCCPIFEGGGSRTRRLLHLLVDRCLVLPELDGRRALCRSGACRSLLLRSNPRITASSQVRYAVPQVKRFPW